MIRTFSALGLLCATPLLAHGGGLDKNGCHTNHKTGDYHCHGGSAAPAPPAYRAPAAPVASTPIVVTPATGLALRGDQTNLGPLPGTVTCIATETLLKALGYYKGVPDAKPDAASLDAAVRFRREHGLAFSRVPMTGELLIRLSEVVLARGVAK